MERTKSENSIVLDVLDNIANEWIVEAKDCVKFSSQFHS